MCACVNVNLYVSLHEHEKVCINGVISVSLYVCVSTHVFVNV